MQTTETPKYINEILHVELWFPEKGNFYFTTIDKFLKYVTIYLFEQRIFFFDAAINSTVNHFDVIKQKIHNYL